MKCPVFKRSEKAHEREEVADGPPVGPGIIDNEDGTITVIAVDDAGNRIDVSQDATISAISSDTSIVGLTAPVGGTITPRFLKATAPESPVNVSITQTFADGKIGPFRVNVPLEVKGDAQTGFKGTWGPPKVRP